MNKVQIGTKLHELLKDNLQEVDLRMRIADIASTIMVEEFKGVVNPDLLTCQKCDLHKHRREVVPGIGPAPTEIMFIGEAPGEKEDLEGKPFIGPAGEMLDKILKATHRAFPKKGRWLRENIYITNTVKCRPEDNTVPHMSERKACKSYLDEEIAKVQPKIIVCWGNTAAEEIIHRNFKMTQEAGLFFIGDNEVRMVALYHPAYILRLERAADPNLKATKQVVWDTIKKINEYLG